LVKNIINIFYLSWGWFFILCCQNDLVSSQFLGYDDGQGDDAPSRFLYVYSNLSVYDYLPGYLWSHLDDKRQEQ